MKLTKLAEELVKKETLKAQEIMLLLDLKSVGKC